MESQLNQIDFVAFERRLTDLENYFLERLKHSNHQAYLRFTKELNQEQTQG